VTIDPSELTPGDGFNNSILAGLGTLIRTMIQSPNYVTGVSGWTINKDGSAEFNNLTIRGTFAGTNFVINSAGIFFYSGTPALGNLVLALTNSAGSDSFGNVYVQGITIGNASGVQVLIEIITGVQAAMQFPTNAAIESVAANMTANNNGSGVTEFLQLVISGPRLNVSAAQDWVQILMNSANQGNTSDANMELLYIGSNQNPHVYGVLDGTGFAITGGVTAAHPGTIPAVAETWQTTAVGNSWTGGPLNFQKLPDNTVLLMASLVTSAAAVNGTIATLPLGYRPANPQPFNGTHALAASFNEHWVINTNGTLVSSGFGASQSVYLDNTYPLDL
jgi:hypothetical protein